MKVLLLFILVSLQSLAGFAQSCFQFGTPVNIHGQRLLVDDRGFVYSDHRGTRHLLPVMGEIHFSRIPEREWKAELLKMKVGGINVVATYFFWNHHNDREGIWEWDGNKNLRRFVQTCKEVEMPVVLRIGPFCHGEVYMGGFPVWVVERCQKEKISMRSADPRWLEMTRDLYSHIFSQVDGLLWKDNGPIIGIQLENECRGPWPYMQALKDMAVEIGYDVPFFTRTGWPRFNGKPVYGEILPLYGDYADGFWDRELTDMPGQYSTAFEMREAKVAATIATEQFTSQDFMAFPSDDDAPSSLLPATSSLLPATSSLLPHKYPYFTCELGGGMMTSYHRRINIFSRDALALAVCKVGCGSNLPGYYMYHGGTNPDNPDHNMAEMQNSPVTNYNDLPHKSYDFQSPLGEVGQPDESFHLTRIFHQFLADWGDQIALSESHIVSKSLALRRMPGDGSKYFIFSNTYVRLRQPDGLTYWQMCGIDGVDSVSAMPFCKTDDCIYYVSIPGVKPRIYGNHSGKQIKILSPSQARRAFKIDGRLVFSHHGGIVYTSDEGICEEYWTTLRAIHAHSVSVCAPRLREVKMGINNAAEQPADSDFLSAASYSIPALAEAVSKAGCSADDLFLRISYTGDVARIYSEGRFIADNFWNGKPFYVRISDITGGNIDIRLLPLGKDYPIYLQPDQRRLIDSTASDAVLSLDKIELVKRVRVPLKD